MIPRKQAKQTHEVYTSIVGGKVGGWVVLDWFLFFVLSLCFEFGLVHWGGGKKAYSSPLPPPPPPPPLPQFPRLVCV